MSVDVYTVIQNFHLKIKGKNSASIRVQPVTIIKREKGNTYQNYGILVKDVIKRYIGLITVLITANYYIKYNRGSLES
jgi:hypothetical protein